MNLIFTVLVVLVLLAVVLPLGRVLWRGPRATVHPEHHVVNAAVLRDQLAELERDRKSGTLSTKDHGEAVQDLQRRVLDEAKPVVTSGKQPRNGKYAALGVAVVLPVASMLLYLQLGNPAAMNPAPTQPSPSITQADVQAMVNSLSARLALNPDDPQGWLMLARSYRYFSRYEEAEKAFAQAGSAIETDPLALTEYAETLARNSPNGFSGYPTTLLERALALSPEEPFALTLAGAAALERRDYDSAISHWQQVLGALPPDSNAARAISESIQHAINQRDHDTTSATPAQ